MEAWQDLGFGEQNGVQRRTDGALVGPFVANSDWLNWCILSLATALRTRSEEIHTDECVGMHWVLAWSEAISIYTESTDEIVIENESA